MSTRDQAVAITLQIDAGKQVPADELDVMARQLRNEIKDFAVESVELVNGGPAPPGTKSPEAVTLGALAVVVLPTVIPKLIDFLQAWLLRGERRTLKIKVGAGDRSVEVEASSAVSANELKALLGVATKAFRSANR